MQDRAFAADQSKLLTAWDSGAPSLPAGQKKDVVTEAAEQVVPELAQRTPQEILLDLMRTENLSVSFYAFALGISLALGALHALTPGHGKTIVAAYLVGSRGTARHAVALGSIVTLTHTGSVFALGLLTLTASRYFFTADFLPLLELLSGVLIVALAIGLLLPRLRAWRENRQAETLPAREIKIEDGKKRLVIDQDITEDAPSHKHDGAIPRKPTVGNPLAELTWRSLITLGVSGGLVPCPDAIAILLVAVAINRILLGLALIVSFSLGLAVVLIVIGMLMVSGGRLFARINFLNRVAPFMPVVSAGVVMILGVVLTYGAVIKIGSKTNSQKTESTLSGAKVFYLAEDENKYKQIFMTEVDLGSPQKITNAEKGVTDFAISPDESQIVYHRANRRSGLRPVADEFGRREKSKDVCMRRGELQSARLVARWKEDHFRVHAARHRELRRCGGSPLDCDNGCSAARISGSAPAGHKSALVAEWCMVELRHARRHPAESP